MPNISNKRPRYIVPNTLKITNNMPVSTGPSTSNQSEKKADSTRNPTENNIEKCYRRKLENTEPKTKSTSNN